MKLSVGDYVRTKDGYIGKAMIVTEYCVNIEDKKVFQIGDIVKSSPNIIDLIEIGDYVNGVYISDKYIDAFKEWIVKRECDDDYYSIAFKNRDIETVVTKEQFEQMEYKLEE